jgi:uncharacterized delta-60 repeat protein
MHPRVVSLASAAALCAVVAGTPVAAAPATCGLDPTFGTSGTGIVVAPDYTLDYGLAVAVDAAGRYVVAGEGGRSIALMRMLPTGTLDQSFGAGTGLVTIRHDDVYSSGALDMAQLTDGRIVLAGYAYWAVSPSSWGDIAVAVLNPDGSRDASFGGGDGVTYLDLNGSNDAARSVDVDGQGRIVIGGTTALAGGASDVVLARLLPDGTLDPAFGAGGMVVSDLGGTYEAANDVDALADGRILAAGSHQTDFVRPWLARFLPSGSLDPSFGVGGLVEPSNGGGWHEVIGNTDGTVLVAGEQELNLAVTRYTATGDADRGFARGGTALVSLGPWPEPTPSASGLAVLSDGDLLVAGAGTRTSYSEGVLVRLTRRGRLETRFGDGGIIRYSEDPQYSASSFSAVAALPSGGGVIAGTGYNGAILARTC